MLRKTERLTPPRSAVVRQGVAGGLPFSSGKNSNLQKSTTIHSMRQLVKMHQRRFKERSINLPQPPATYDANARYLIELGASVEVPNSGGIWLRPRDEVVVLGSFAATIASKILGAKLVEPAPQPAPTPAPVPTPAPNKVQPAPASGPAKG